MRRFALLRSTLGTVWLFSTLAILSISGASANAQSQPAIFPIPTYQYLPNEGIPLFIGDFNGDGIPDLAYNSFTTGTLGILVDFAGSAPKNVTTTICPGAVFADVNNDKKLDAVSSCNGYIKVQLGNGDATFQAPAYYATNAINPLLVDLNGDGYLDIAATLMGAQATSQVVVLLNNGSTGPGVFGSPKQYALPTGATGLFAGDFNGDGKQDLLTTVLYYGTPTKPSPSFPTASDVDILFGNGDGTLRQATVQSGPPFASLTVADFNGDGVTDLAGLLASSTDPLYTSVQIFIGTTSGTFTQGASLPVVAINATAQGVGGPMAAVSLSDHGPPDLVVDTGVLNFFHNDGKANFTPTGSYGVTTYPLLFADVNGDGKQDLIASDGSGTLFIFPGNGDGTIQAPPVAPFFGPTADVNNDGIADLVFSPQLQSTQGPSNFFATALGRGDGTYSILDQTTTLPSASYYLLVTGDFNGDGKIDTLAIQPGSSGPNALCGPPDAQLFSYLGMGNGRFQANGTAFALGVGSVQSGGITGDFNSDGKLDVILPYGCGQNNILFLPGNGDGTFGAPVLLNSTQTLQYPGLLAGDLNNDKKLDFIYGNAVFLGNGDGTFKQSPLDAASPSASVIGLADLNGDGILDAVYSPGTSIYAGNGDGTFQTTPFYTVPLSCGTNGLCAIVHSFALGDVNGDGNPDLLLVETSGTLPIPSFVLYLGDGHGHFTQDPNYYFWGTLNGIPWTTTPARLNNQAPPLASDNRLDLSVAVTVDNSVTYTVSLLNQTNPTPVKPAPITSTTALQTSPATAAPNASITLTASVFGTNPSGSVSFTANGKSLGTEAVANGIATLQTSFAATGSYSVTATYQGDQNNAASTSSAATIVIAAPDFTVSASPTSGTITPGQTATFTFTVSPVGGYGGTVSFSCGTLPSQAACSFSPASVTPSGGSPASTTMTVTTAVSSATLNPERHSGSSLPPWLPVGGLAMAGSIGLIFTRNRTWRLNSQSRGLCWALLLASLSLLVSGCGGGGNSSSSSSGTPAGSYTVSVNASGSAGGPQHAMSITLIVQ